MVSVRWRHRPTPLAAGDRVSGWPAPLERNCSAAGTSGEARPGARQERLSQLLTWALLQDGGQAEACTACAQTRRVPAGKLRGDPGAGLPDTQARVLRQDLALRLVAVSTPTGPTILRISPGGMTWTRLHGRLVLGGNFPPGG
jgi:hypothetical protein